VLNDLPPLNLELLLASGSQSIMQLARAVGLQGASNGLRQVKVMDVMQGMTKNFHPDGLYSIETFGRVGDRRRSRTFAYIDLQLGVFHPVYFKALTDLKGLYGEILASREYAVFDYKTKDFVKSDPVHGQTGFSFFLEHFKDLTFESRPSPKRTYNIRLIEKHRDAPFMEKLLVMPAGLRDYVVDADGKPSEDEINTLYRRVIGLSKMLSNISIDGNQQYLDNSRYNLQIAVNAIYDYIVSLLEGKGKLIQGKWARRSIENSTRNVITPYVPTVRSKDDPQMVRTDQTVVGLYQYMRTIMPRAIHSVREGFLSEVFPGPNSPAVVTDPSTLESVQVPLDPSYYDEWMTNEGLEKLMAKFKIKDLRHEPIKLGDYYMGLCYLGPDGTFKLIQGIDEIPEGRDPKDVTPITPAILFYTSLYKESPRVPGIVTRYPITGYGSVYPAYIYLKTTIRGEVRTELGYDWSVTDNVAPEFPIKGEYFFDALSPATQHLGRLGADYDGDTCSLTCFLVDESYDEIQTLMHSREYYVNVDGTMAFGSGNDVLNLVLANIS